MEHGLAIQRSAVLRLDWSNAGSAATAEYELRSAGLVVAAAAGREASAAKQADDIHLGHGLHIDAFGGATLQPKLNGEVLTSAPAADGQAQFQFVVSEKKPALAEAVEGTLLLADLPRIAPTTFELAQWKRAAARAGRNNLIYVDNKCPHPLLLEPTASGASDGRLRRGNFVILTPKLSFIWRIPTVTRIVSDE